MIFYISSLIKLLIIFQYRYFLLACLHLFQQDCPMLKKLYNQNITQTNKVTTCHFWQVQNKQNPLDNMNLGERNELVKLTTPPSLKYLILCKNSSNLKDPKLIQIFPLKKNVSSFQ